MYLLDLDLVWIWIKSDSFTIMRWNRGVSKGAHAPFFLTSPLSTGRKMNYGLTLGKMVCSFRNSQSLLILEREFWLWTYGCWKIFPHLDQHFTRGNSSWLPNNSYFRWRWREVVFCSSTTATAITIFLFRAILHWYI